MSSLINHMRRLYAPAILLLVVTGICLAFLVLSLQNKQNQARLEDNQRLSTSLRHAVEELKADNTHQTELIIKQTDAINTQTKIIECLVNLHGVKGDISEEDRQRCTVEATRTVSQPSSSPAPVTTPNSSSQNTNNQGQGTTPPTEPEQPQQPPEPPPTVFDTLETTVCSRVGIIIRCEEI